MNPAPEYSEEYYEMLARTIGEEQAAWARLPPEEREKELRWYHEHFDTPDDLALWPPELDGGLYNGFSAPDLANELREPAVAYAAPSEAAAPEPWSHPWHDQLGLLYHRAMAEKIRRHPALLEIARENLSRWLAAETEAGPSEARQEWQRILESGDVAEIIRLMIDPSEEGHRRRQSTPFAGILTPEEWRAIRDELL